jgi:hypothetical protein
MRFSRAGVRGAARRTRRAVAEDALERAARALCRKLGVRTVDGLRCRRGLARQHDRFDRGDEPERERQEPSRQPHRAMSAHLEHGATRPLFGHYVWIDSARHGTAAARARIRGLSAPAWQTHADASSFFSTASAQPRLAWGLAGLGCWMFVMFALVSPRAARARSSAKPPTPNHVAGTQDFDDPAQRIVASREKLLPFSSGQLVRRAISTTLLHEGQRAVVGDEEMLEKTLRRLKAIRAPSPTGARR